jgi:PAS domain S-box-containing protein
VRGLRRRAAVLVRAGLGGRSIGTETGWRAVTRGSQAGSGRPLLAGAALWTALVGGISFAASLDAPGLVWHHQLLAASSILGVVWVLGLCAFGLAVRFRRRQQLEEQTANWRELFDSIPAACHETDRDGILRSVNSAACALLGYDAGAMLGRPVWDFVAPAGREACQQSVLARLAGRQPAAPDRRAFVRRDGIELLIERQDILVFNERGQIRGLRSVLFDVTESVRAATAAGRQAGELEAVQTALQACAGEVVRTGEELSALRREVEAVTRMPGQHHAAGVVRSGGEPLPGPFTDALGLLCAAIGAAQSPQRGEAPCAPDNAVSGAPQGDAPAALENEECGGATARVLVVDDDAAGQAMVIEILDKLGFRADAAASGVEAIRVLELTSYDAVLMDIEMPEMDGVEATLHIRNPESAVLNHAVPIFGMAAPDTEGVQERLLQAGMDGYLVKPVSAHALSALVASWLPPDIAAVPSRAVPAPDEAANPDADSHNRTLARAVLDDFWRDTPARIDGLRTSLAARDALCAVRQARGIQGSSAAIAASSLVALAAEVECLSRAGELELAAHRLEKLDSEFDRLRQTLFEPE